MNQRRPSRRHSAGAGQPGWVVWIAAGGVAVLLLAVLLPRRTPVAPDPALPASSASPSESAGPFTASSGGRDLDPARLMRSRSGPDPSRAPDAIVRDKVTDFARNRRRQLDDMAQRFQVQIPPEVDQLFSAAEAGHWSEIKGLYNTLSAQRESGGGSRDLDVLWPAVREMYGVAELSQSWPPQELLNYGETILNSLRPGMVYVAGSDAARFAPMLLGETGGGDRPIILPQGGLVDASQLEYLRFKHGDRLASLTPEDAQQVFNTYLQEAHTRVAAAPQGGEAAPGSSVESALFTPGRATVSGPEATAALNEKMLQLLMARNPSLSFALEQSVAMGGLTTDAAPLGPLLELRAGSVSSGADRSGMSLEYWEQTAQRLQADASLPPDSPARAAYAQLVTSQAQYFASRELPAEAEQAYRIAHELAPASFDAVGHLTRYLASRGRQDEALQIVDAYSRANEGQAFLAEELRKSLTQPTTGSPAP